MVRIDEVVPLRCLIFCGQMRLIALIAEGMHSRRNLDHVGVDSEPQHFAPARGPPPWEDGGAQMGYGVQIEPG